MARINVVSTRLIKSGDTNGRAWSLYEVTATKEDGTPITSQLKSFEPLTGLVDVEFEKQEHPTYGVSYVVKAAGGGGGGGGGQAGGATDILHEQVAALQRRVTALEERVQRLDAPTPPDIPTTLAPVGGVPIDADDIPF